MGLRCDARRFSIGSAKRVRLAITMSVRSKRRRWCSAAALAVALVAATLPAHAAFRCGTRLIATGDHVRVDGSGGVVEILRAGEPAAERATPIGS